MELNATWTRRASDGQQSNAASWRVGVIRAERPGVTNREVLVGRPGSSAHLIGNSYSGKTGS